MVVVWKLGGWLGLVVDIKRKEMFSNVDFRGGRCLVFGIWFLLEVFKFFLFI